MSPSILRIRCPTEYFYLTGYTTLAIRNEVDRYLGIVSSSGGNGAQVEFVSTNTDQRGVGIYGYEDPMAQAFQEKYGRSAFDAPSDDTSS